MYEEHIFLDTNVVCMRKGRIGKLLLGPFACSIDDLGRCGLDRQCLPGARTIYTIQMTFNRPPHTSFRDFLSFTSLINEMTMHIDFQEGGSGGWIRTTDLHAQARRPYPLGHRRSGVGTRINGQRYWPLNTCFISYWAQFGIGSEKIDRAVTTTDTHLLRRSDDLQDN